MRKAVLHRAIKKTFDLELPMAQLLEVPKMTVLDDEGTLAGLPKTGDQNQRMVQVLICDIIFCGLM
ncbi:hypothetical protein I5Q83_05935 [Enterocloster clostridioformis]|nr:hypothetical protein [Enterocloster clostridioformis]NDO31950.1 hypothetical protein [Enterocloster clostridioformis]QQR01852.1 hypothetical protein I5Q83_05935 [Enterocloster clostridioformis]